MRKVLSIPDRLAHEPPLDGLRALAVIAVMFFHHDARWAPGGFLGVDVFFVLSGFLITSLLLIDHAHTGSTISWGFWARRARRLLPALFVMLVLFGFYYAFVAAPADIPSIRGGSFATLFFAKNYWDALSSHRSRWLPHAWSLSIEEQFYVIWPLVLALLLRSSRHKSSRVLGGIIVLVAASAAVRLAWSFHNPTYANEALETRASTLLVGAGLAVLLMAVRPPTKTRQRTLLNVCGVAALASLTASFLVTRTENYAWLWYGGGVGIAIATATLIVAAIHGDGLVRRVLSNRWLRRIGLISYGLYLYHVLIFQWISPDRYDMPGWLLFVVRFGLSFALAAASYQLIERPFRRGGVKRTTLRIVTIVSAVIVVGVIVGSTQFNALDLPPGVSVPMRLNWRHLAATTPLGDQRTLVAGDAIAVSLASTFPRHIRQTMSVSSASVDGCGIADGDIVVGEVRFPTKECTAWPAVYKTAIADFKPHLVVLAVGVNEIFDRSVGAHALRVPSVEFDHYMSRRLETASRILTSRGAELVILGAPCMRSASSSSSSDRFVIARNDQDRVAWLNGVLKRYASKVGAKYVDVQPLICTGAVRTDPRAIPTAFTPAESSAVWNAVEAQLLSMRHIRLPDQSDERSGAS